MFSIKVVSDPSRTGFYYYYYYSPFDQLIEIDKGATVNSGVKCYAAIKLVVETEMNTQRQGLSWKPKKLGRHPRSKRVFKVHDYKSMEINES